MLYFNRVHVSEGTDVNKSKKSKVCDICHYLYFLRKGFKFQPYVCNRCHDLLMMSINLSNISILKIKSADYCCIITGISKSATIKLLQNIYLDEKRGKLFLFST